MHTWVRIEIFHQRMVDLWKGLVRLKNGSSIANAYYRCLYIRIWCSTTFYDGLTHKSKAIIPYIFLECIMCGLTLKNGRWGAYHIMKDGFYGKNATLKRKYISANVTRRFRCIAESIIFDIFVFLNWNKG